MAEGPAVLPEPAGRSNTAWWVLVGVVAVVANAVGYLSAGYSRARREARDADNG